MNKSMLFDTLLDIYDELETNKLYKNDNERFVKELLRSKNYEEVVDEILRFANYKEINKCIDLAISLHENVKNDLLLKLKNIVHSIRDAQFQKISVQVFLLQCLYEESLEYYENWKKNLIENDFVGLVSVNLGISACLKLLGKEKDKARNNYLNAIEIIETIGNKKNDLMSGSLWERLSIYIR